MLRPGLFKDMLRQLLAEAGFVIAGEMSRTDAPAGSIPGSDIVLVDSAYCIGDAGALDRLRDGIAGKMVLLAADSDLPFIALDRISAVDGILTTGMSSAQLIDSLRLIHGGERVVPSLLMQRLSAVRSSAAAPPGDAAAPPYRHPLSMRETDILRHLMRGTSNKQIAMRLGIAEATVKVHVKGLLRKIDAANRTQAAVWALQHGFSDGDVVRATDLAHEAEDRLVRQRATVERLQRRGDPATLRLAEKLLETLNRTADLARHDLRAALDAYHRRGE